MPEAPDLSVLGEMPLFEGVAPDHMARLGALLRHRIVPPGRSIISAEQPGEVAYIILSGTVKIHVEQADGSDVLLAILGPGEVVGEMSLADRGGRSANVVTLEECAVLWIDRVTFGQYLRMAPALSFNLARILSRRLRIANAHIQSLATLDVYGRVARQLVAFADEYGQPLPAGGVVIPFRLTQTDLAALVGASRVRVNQVLGEFRDRGLITIDQNLRILVHDPDALAERLG